MQATDARTIVVNAPRGRVDTAVFGKRPFMRSPRLSPDGTKIAVMMTKDGVDSLGYIDVTKPGSAPIFFAQAEEFREAGDRTIGSWRFVGNRTIVFTVASREIIGGRRSDVSRLVSYDLETKKISPLSWDGAGGSGAKKLWKALVLEADLDRIVVFEADDHLALRLSQGPASPAGTKRGPQGRRARHQAATRSGPAGTHPAGTARAAPAFSDHPRDRPARPRPVRACVEMLIEEASKHTHLSQPIETSKLPHRHHPLRHRVWRGYDLV
jgi:hypothetical protein